MTILFHVKHFDVVVIGGGHNGLACAAYLARAGMDVLVLERRHVLGGAAVTEEPWPGYRISSASYVMSLMPPEVVRELELEPVCDILASVARLEDRPFCVGFAAETDQVEDNAHKKRLQKGIDMIAANRVEIADTLEIPAITTITRIGDDQVIKRTLFRARARKTNANHLISVINAKKAETPASNQHSEPCPIRLRIVPVSGQK